MTDVPSLEDTVHTFHKVMGGLKHKCDSLAPLYRGTDNLESVLDGTYRLEMEEEQLQEDRRNTRNVESSLAFRRDHHENRNLFGSSSSSDGDDNDSDDLEDLTYFNMFASLSGCDGSSGESLTKTRRISYQSKS